MEKRTPEVRDAIIRALGVSRAKVSEITAEDLAKIEKINLNRRVKSLKVGDFDGLVNLKDLLLASNNLEALPVGIFWGLVSLELLSLDENALDPYRDRSL